MLALVLEVGLGGCAFSSNPAPASGTPAGADGGAMTDAEIRPAPDAAVPIDDARPIDAAPIDAGPAQPSDVCLGRFDGICVAPPTVSVTLGTQTLDTSSSARCVDYRLAPGAPAVDACVIAGTSIVIEGNNTVEVTGRRPLILLSTSSITISGVLDAASHRTSPSSKTGPGADAPQCSATVTDPTVGASNNGGGGRGGTFGATGGNGGSGAMQGQGGIAAPTESVTSLQGGCPGSAGAGNDAGARGHGGGAVMLIARQTIALDGTINASGAAGSAGKNSAGGGGGGSGGMIVLDAATVNVTGKCFANGGGGGEGGDLSSTGNPGGESSKPGEVGIGGGGANRGGKGGDGGGAGGRAAAAGIAGTTHNSSSGAQDGLGGGGGGGGGVGVLKVSATGQAATNGAGAVEPRPSL